MPSYPAKARALYAYASEHDDDLKFENGQLITVIAAEDKEWLHGEYKDSSGSLHTGIFPRSFVEFLGDETTPLAKSSTTISPAAETIPENETSSSGADEPDLGSETGPHTSNNISLPRTNTDAAVPVVAAQKDAHQRRSASLGVAQVSDKSVPAPLILHATSFDHSTGRTTQPLHDQEPSKPLSFRDRIAAFNKAASQPPPPKPPTSAKKWTPPPPAKSSFVSSPPKINKPILKPDSHRQPDIVNSTLEEKIKTSEDLASVTSLRERIAALHTTRFEPTVPKAKPPVPGRQENKTSIEDGQPSQQAASSGPSENTSPIVLRRSMSEDVEQDQVEDIQIEDTPVQESEEEIDPEQAKRQAIRERIAKMSGGMGMALALGMSPATQKSKPKPPPPPKPQEEKPVSSPVSPVGLTAESPLHEPLQPNSEESDQDVPGEQLISGNVELLNASVDDDSSENSRPILADSPEEISELPSPNISEAAIPSHNRKNTDPVSKLPASVEKGGLVIETKVEHKIEHRLSKSLSGMSISRLALDAGSAITDTEGEGYEADEDTDAPRPSSSQKDVPLTIVTANLHGEESQKKSRQPYLQPLSPPPRPPPELSSPSSRDRPPVPRASVDFTRPNPPRQSVEWSRVEADRNPPIRPSVDRSRMSIDSRLGNRISLDWSRPLPEHGFLARDVELEENEWWTQEKMPPPTFQDRTDILFEMDESVTPHRGGRSSVSKDIYVLYADYSQTIITAHFESNVPSQVTLSQRHKPPPPFLSREELVEAAEKFNKQLLDFITPQVGSVIGDGTSDDLVLQAIRHIPAALPPIGHKAYGALIYTNLANASVQQFDEIRPGDVVSFRNVKFQGHKGGLHSKYTVELSSHVGVVSSEWDGAKRKLRMYEQGRDGKKLDEKSYRLNDFRSGELRVWRVMDRSCVEW